MESDSMYGRSRYPSWSPLQQVFISCQIDLKKGNAALCPSHSYLLGLLNPDPIPRLMALILYLLASIFFNAEGFDCDGQSGGLITK
jgi:hypothetical protein